MKYSRRVKNILTFIGMALIGLIFVGLIEANRAEPAESSDIQRIYQYVLRTDRNPPTTFINRYGMIVKFKQIDRKIKLSPPHGDFDWSWDIHIAYIQWAEDNKGIIYPLSVGLDVKHYTENVSGPFKDLIIENFRDDGLDGKLDAYQRTYILASNEDALWLPSFPKGFINPKWVIPDKEESQALYDSEVRFWLQYIEKLENNGANN